MPNQLDPGFIKVDLTKPQITVFMIWDIVVTSDIIL